MEFHISRRIREQIDLKDLLFSFSGNVIFANVTASRKLAARMQSLLPESQSRESVINGAALFAMGLIDELSHAFVANYRKNTDPLILADGLRFLAERTDVSAIHKLLSSFTDEFPNLAVFRNELSVEDWLRGQTDGIDNQEIALEELLLLWLANQNPGFSPFKILFDDKHLKDKSAYQAATSALPDYFKTRPLVESGLGTLLDALTAPILASPDSLAGQLEYIRQHWSPILGEDVGRILLAIDTLREEEVAIWMRFHPPGSVWHRHGEPSVGSEGFVGDEFVGFDSIAADHSKSARLYPNDYQSPLHEYEAFSTDQAWMPTVVLVAKNTYVWLEQLSKKYGRHIYRLDQIPNQELQILADRGITGLWLIGLWERSIASRTIKRLRGNNEAVASAYSLKSYTIAEDLGGEAAFQYLKQQSSRLGLRLASDMVPNHMGIDSDWVIEHPDWFLSRWDSPFPVYSFEGPDLSTDPRVEIKIEDHYYDHSDAAVVFRLRHYANGNTRFVYHGNDGTTFAWNDTAQLDYLKKEVREHVIQVILEVARRFPIIRFDAAMVLAKRHVQRLWFPLPGMGGSIPSRAEYALSEEAFNALMPHEFWREVVDRVEAEVPGTLLLAEAFWLLEGYFVRTLGMHRVYNSAFMIMLRDEENAKYRSYLKKTVEFDPDILKRYVNFMSNPDERTAIDQFGSGDKYFGVSVLLATLPGLPMFGHGQIEGFTERYGMDFKQARLDEYPNDDLVNRHQHLIAPLLKARHLFAESEQFLLYDFWNDHGTVDENVFAYSNRQGSERALIIYNNSYQSTHGTIHFSVGFLDKTTGTIQQRSLSYGLNLPQDNSLIAYRDNVVGLEYLRYVSDLHEHGLSLSLRGYQHLALLHWRELYPTATEPWDQLCDALRGSGVYSLSEALSKLRIRPLLEVLHQAISPEIVEGFAIRSSLPIGISEQPRNEEALVDYEQPQIANPAQTSSPQDEFAILADEFLERMRNLLSQETSVALQVLPTENLGGAVDASLELPRMLAELPATLAQSSAKVFPTLERETSSDLRWGPLLAWMIFRNLSPVIHPFQAFETFNIRWALAETFSSLGFEGEAAWKAAAQVRILAKFFEKSPQEVLSMDEFWIDPDVRWLIGVNNAGGIEYVNQERLEETVLWMHLPELLRIDPHKTRQSPNVKALADFMGRFMKLVRLANFEYLGLMRLTSTQSTEKQPQAASLQIPADDTTTIEQGVIPGPLNSSERTKKVTKKR